MAVVMVAETARYPGQIEYRKRFDKSGPLVADVPNSLGITGSEEWKIMHQCGAIYHFVSMLNGFNNQGDGAQFQARHSGEAVIQKIQGKAPGYRGPWQIIRRLVAFTTTA